MKVVIAIDSFKGSLSTFQAGNAIKDGIKKVYSDSEVKVSPLADGGEGTVEAIIGAMNGRLESISVCGPLGDTVRADYGIIPESKTAIMEMASAAGITLIDAEKRNPLYATTYGVGEMIADAAKKGCREFIVGIGGSATNDGGTGMLAALGIEFLDKNGEPIKSGAQGLKDLAEIRTDKLMPEVKESHFCIACDVKNILCGESGCSAVYGPQKGADEKMIKDMDGWLKNYAALTKTVNPKADENYPGTGAAGGLGFAFLSYLNSELKSGIDIVIEATRLEEYVKDADIVVTGEGRLDGQSYMGKAPIGVAKLAKKYGKRVIAFSGCVTEDAVTCNDHGIDAFFPILREPCTLQDAMDTDNAYRNLKNTAEQVFRLIKVYE